MATQRPGLLPGKLAGIAVENNVKGEGGRHGHEAFLGEMGPVLIDVEADVAVRREAAECREADEGPVDGCAVVDGDLGLAGRDGDVHVVLAAAGCGEDIVVVVPGVLGDVVCGKGHTHIGMGCTVMVRIGECASLQGMKLETGNWMNLRSRIYVTAWG